MGSAVRRGAWGKRLDETTEIPVPRFGGTKGQEHQRVCIKVEKLFLEHLRLVCHNHRKTLDVQEATWLDNMLAFRAEMKDLEIIIENLINVMFKDMNNVGETIGNLYGLRIYMNRINLRPLFNSLTTLVSWSTKINTLCNRFIREKKLKQKQKTGLAIFFKRN